MIRFVVVSRELVTDVMPRDVTEGAMVSAVDMTGDREHDRLALLWAVESILNAMAMA